MNWWKRKFSNKGHNFWASFSNPEGLKAWGGQHSLQMPVRVDGADDLKAVTIQSSLTLILSWERETAPAIVSVLNYILPQCRWLQCWEIKFIRTTPRQALGGQLISAPSTSTWKHEKKKDERTGQRAGRTIPLSSWQAMASAFPFSWPH